MNKRIVRRDSVAADDAGLPLLDRLYRVRGAEGVAEREQDLKSLLPPDALLGVTDASSLLADHLIRQSHILIVGDFDADGATSCALMVTVLRAMGGTHVDYLVPDRFRFGYGLTPEIVDVALGFTPDLIVTVDNGISSIEGVDHARSYNIDVLITDHHLPGQRLPQAQAIVNPNQQGCAFPSKHLAGVGVAFYLLSALRAELRHRQHPGAALNLADFLDLVALGTVADVVPLDQNNRRLVQAGLRRIRAGRARPGIAALLQVSGCDQRYATSQDLAFSLAPRLNAAGRLHDMSLGIECLMADKRSADELARQLDAINTERKEIETGMREQALQYLEGLAIETERTAGLCLYQPDWHEGIVGIVASRIKDRSHRPVIAFARTDTGELKGSGRSVQGFHMRDALDVIATENPGLLKKFGGHAMAAGLSLEEAKLKAFMAAFDDEVRRQLGEAVIEQVVLTDGELGEEITLAVARELESAGPWGQGFPVPEFDDDFEILEQRIVGERHLKLLLQPTLGGAVEAICFNHPNLVETRYVRCAYRLEVNRYRGFEKPQLLVSLIL